VKDGEKRLNIMGIRAGNDQRKWGVGENFIVSPQGNAVLEKKQKDGQNVNWNIVQSYSHRYSPVSSIKKYTHFSP